jgi:hypothetical protein
MNTEPVKRDSEGFPRADVRNVSISVRGRSDLRSEFTLTRLRYLLMQPTTLWVTTLLEYSGKSTTLKDASRVPQKIER